MLVSLPCSVPARLIFKFNTAETCEERARVHGDLGDRHRVRCIKASMIQRVCKKHISVQAR